MKLVAEFNIYALPQTINAIGRKHWGLKVKEAKRWKRLVGEQCIFKNIHGLGLKTARLELTRRSSKEPDFDNLASSFKHVIDALVESYVIVDDKPSVISSPVFIWEKAKMKEGSITVRIFTDQDVPSRFS